MRRLVLTALAALALTPSAAAGESDVRFATFNASLNRNFAGQLRTDLSTPGNAQAATVAEIIQRVRPDVLLINEFDFDPVALELFRDNYLEVPHNGALAIFYDHAYIAPSNTGIPSGFDGPEDRNGTRNTDEIRLWADYITPSKSGYIYDDAGRAGGLKPGELFVIAGDQNSDPLDGDSIPGSIQQLLEHPLVNAKLTPSSAGAVEAAALQGGANATHRSDPRFDTADFADGAPGNLRADYVLPRKSLQILDAGVFWPLLADPLSRLTGVFSFDWIAVGGFPTSDHRLTWVDVEVPTVK